MKFGCFWDETGNCHIQNDEAAVFSYSSSASITRSRDCDFHFFLSQPSSLARVCARGEGVFLPGSLLGPLQRKPAKFDVPKWCLTDLDALAAASS